MKTSINYKGNNEVSTLIVRFLSGSLDKAGEVKLKTWVDASELNETLLEDLAKPESLTSKLATWHAGKQRMEVNWDKLQEQLSPVKVKAKALTKTLRWIAAACTLIVFATIAGYFLGKIPGIGAASSYLDNISPGGNRAILDIEGGASYQLEEQPNGLVRQVQNIRIIKNDSLLQYLPADSGSLTISPTVQYHTIKTPRGGKYQVILSDGTRLFINAESSARFPVPFNGDYREVEVTGKVYFNVMKNKPNPFLVTITSSQGVKGVLRVVGTRFSVNAYNADSVITTLLEGELEIFSGKENRRIHEGQEARWAGTDSIRVEKVQKESISGLDRGWFRFDDKDIGFVMQELSKWYQFNFEIDKSAENTRVILHFPPDKKINEVFRLFEDFKLETVELKNKVLIKASN